ncbi:hypothetical protein KHC28_11605 [Ancylobacter sonchi]|uniref:hypothetical protein n=1 Tax=Ancylobacter sonchi TaxID=1937790 RepID=UPI001BD22285|nr:hypothetical protein [Ancylobacter sonchi]MBS7534303.1 hypothetical protein [Ancylobacter sonchi]
MTYQGPPPPPPVTLQDRLEGPVLVAIFVIATALMGFSGAGELYPAPIAIVGALFWHDRVRRRNQERGQFAPNLVGYLLIFVVFAYLGYGVGSFAADQMY